MVDKPGVVLYNGAMEEEVLRRYQEHQISLGKAAELLGLPKREFITLLARKGIPYFDYSDEELENELGAAEISDEMRERLLRQRKEVAAGERGRPLEDVERELGLDPSAQDSEDTDSA